MPNELDTNAFIQTVEQALTFAHDFDMLNNTHTGAELKNVLAVLKYHNKQEQEKC